MKSGFTLIELLIYLAVFSIMLFVVFHFITTMHQRVMEASRWANRQNNFYVACQSMGYIFQEAPASKKYWKKITDQEVVFHNNSGDIGFAFNKKQLVKKTGTYVAGFGWRSKHVTVLAEQIEELHFYYDISDEVVIGIFWELMAKHREKNYTIKQYIYLRNRNII